MKIRVICIIKDSTSAIKFDGSGNGCEVALQIPQAYMAEAIKMVTMTKQVLVMDLMTEEEAIAEDHLPDE
jgi:hypothetical protein